MSAKSVSALVTATRIEAPFCCECSEGASDSRPAVCALSHFGMHETGSPASQHLRRQRGPSSSISSRTRSSPTCDNRAAMTAERTRDLMTPDQAADYLQVSRETVYRYIRDGKLGASRLGRTYRISRTSLDLLLWATRARSDPTPRRYTSAEIEQFLKDDQLDDRAREIADRFLTAANFSEDFNEEPGSNRPR
jgi:excisionase family DNA binding protein